jgi:hypothetical protein
LSASDSKNSYLLEEAGTLFNSSNNCAAQTNDESIRTCSTAEKTKIKKKEIWGRVLKSWNSAAAAAAAGGMIT